jgi:hypothetical protein
MTVRETRERSLGTNFHLCLLDGERGLRILVLCNGVYPVLAFAAPPIQMCRITFIDGGELAQPFRDLGYECASQAQLEAGIDSTDLAMLDEVEREQIRYWKTSRIGDLLFNWFD